MKKLNELLQELGLSKVKLSKYLGVSRQMVYNYLTLDSLDKWPKEKRVLLLQLLDIKDAKDETLDSIVVDTSYMIGVEKRLNLTLKANGNGDTYLDLDMLTKENKILFNDFAFLIKEKLEDNTEEGNAEVRYLYYLFQSIDNIPEIKYLLGYMAKANGFIKPDENVFDENKQFIFEGIMYTALTLYNNGGASKSKIEETHKKFIQEIEARNEEKMSRTQQLNTVKVQALKELGYSEVNTGNAAEVFEKMAEIETRKV